MFDYCVQQLHLSESEAYLRIRAARVGRQFPRVLQMLAAGELHLSAVKLLAPVLTRKNCEQLVSAARLKSKRDVEHLVAQLAPQPNVPTVIRKLPQQARERERAPEAQTAVVSSVSKSSPARKTERQSAPLTATFTPNSTLSPLAPSRFKVQLTANQQLHDKLRQAQDLLRHELPDGDLAQVLERALDLLIAQRMKQRFGQSSKPRARRQGAAPKPDSRHVPNEVRRAVLERDGMRCSYVSAEGKRCEQRGWLELHHEQPYGRGGAPTVANIRVLCRAHNDLLAERDYGRDFIRCRIEHARAARRGDGPHN
jgi:5-methylcytosine-specific restriction endonuclease McrA